jgi:predicted nucleic acid-binding protein
MLVLDTDHVSEFQRGTSKLSAQLKEKLEYSDEIIATSIITLEEQTRG